MSKSFGRSWLETHLELLIYLIFLEMIILQYYHKLQINSIHIIIIIDLKVRKGNNLKLNEFKTFE